MLRLYISIHVKDCITRHPVFPSKEGKIIQGILKLKENPSEDHFKTVPSFVKLNTDLHPDLSSLHRRS